MHFNIINGLNQLGLLNLKYNKLKQNMPNGNDWGDNEKIFNWYKWNMGFWYFSEIDNGKCDAFEMENRMVNASEMDAMRGVVRFIKAHITP